MSVIKALDRDYLQGQSKTKFLVATVSFILLFFLGWLMDRSVGSHVLQFMGVGVISFLLMIPMLILKQDELAAVFCLAVHIYVDWYLGLAFIGMALTLVLLVVLFLRRFSQHPWVWPRARGTWIVLLALTLIRTVGAPSFLYGADYYINVFLIALFAFWLGSIIAKDTASIRHSFIGISILGTLIAIHTLLQVTTGHFFFQISVHASYSSIISYFDATSPGIHRAESFLLNADTNGNFFAILLFVPLSLLITSTSSLAKGFYVSTILLMLAAMFLTYSTESFLACGVGLLLFIMLSESVRQRLRTLLSKHNRHRFQILLVIVVALLVLIVVFRSRLYLLYIHAINPAEVSTRLAAWQTGIAVIKTHLLTGLGIGRDVYLRGAEPYRVRAQHSALSHPHDSYLELAALGGIPVACVFILLLVIFFWRSWHNWKCADALTRSVLAGGMVATAVLSLISLLNAGWTLAPLAMIGWLLLGIVSSPLLTQNLKPGNMREGA